MIKQLMCKLLGHKWNKATGSIKFYEWNWYDDGYICYKLKVKQYCKCCGARSQRYIDLPVNLIEEQEFEVH